MRDAENALKAEESQMSAAEFIASVAPMTATSGQIDILAELGGITRADSILEIWCGSGDLTVQLAGIGGRTVGADYSRKLIDAAAERFPEVEFVVSEADALDFPDASFDVVISNFTAHHYSEPEKVFAEACRVLRPGGRVLVIMPVQSARVGFNIVLGIARGYLELPEKVVTGGPLLDTEDPEVIAGMLREAGCDSAAGTVRLHHTVLTDIDPLLAYAWKKIGLAQASTEVQQAVRSTALAELAGYRRADGVYSLPDRVMAVRGVRAT
jgi:SAM-dependent methyltransferase